MSAERPAAGGQGLESDALRAASPTASSPLAAGRAPLAAPLPLPLPLRHELARKALHLTAAGVPVAYALGAPRALLLPALLALVAVAALIEVARVRSARARERFLRAAGVLLRAHEHERLSGATWLLVAFAVAVALYPRDVAVAAMWAVAVGDASAAVIGRLASRRAHRAAAARGDPPPAGKTLAGSAACFVTTLAGALGVAALPLVQAIVAALAAALAERPGGPIDDNIRVVVTVGVGILLWRMVFS